MNSHFEIPSKSLKYVLFQRTAYIQSLNFLKIFSFKSYPSFLSYENAVTLESVLRKNGIKRAYLEDLKQDYHSIKSAFPTSCTRMLDIGCGIAGIDLFLSRHYNNNIDIYLLDKTHLEKKVFYMFEDKGAFYNSLDLAKECLTRNKIDPDRVHLIEANDQNEINLEGELDLVVSLISWGFHYPISVYSDRVYELLRTGGVLILDVRKETSGIKDIEKKYGNYEILKDSPKYLRIRVEKHL